MSDCLVLIYSIIFYLQFLIISFLKTCNKPNLENMQCHESIHSISQTTLLGYFTKITDQIKNSIKTTLEFHSEVVCIQTINSFMKYKIISFEMIFAWNRNIGLFLSIQLYRKYWKFSYMLNLFIKLPLHFWANLFAIICHLNKIFCFYWTQNEGVFLQNMLDPNNIWIILLTFKVLIENTS